VLSVWAHPDDEAICAAGTLALCAARGEHVSLICATRGENGPISDPVLAERSTLAQARERELREACAAIGVSELAFLDLPDGAVQWAAAANEQTLSSLVVSIRRLRPRVLISFGPDGLYGHPDHIAIGQLTSDARRAAADPSFATADCAAYHVPRHFLAVWSAEQVATLLQQLMAAGTPGQLWQLEPRHFPCSERDVSARVDVTHVITQKLRAIRAHRTQLAHDHALLLLDERSARQTIGIERFRCADGLQGDPVTAQV
jgi:N-acetyl-1-D-myo-inositol-2-amino-2-deoxy-alpha-D-glucopyranoside deacetylase